MLLRHLVAMRQKSEDKSEGLELSGPLSPTQASGRKGVFPFLGILEVSSGG